MSRPQTRMSRYKAFWIDAYLDWTVSRELSMTWVDAYPKCVDAYHEWIDASVYVSMQKLMIHKSESLNTYESMQDAMHRCIYCLYRSMLLCIDASQVFQQNQYAMVDAKSVWVDSYWSKMVFVSLVIVWVDAMLFVSIQNHIMSKNTSWSI